jgi:hypothetical protein
MTSGTNPSLVLACRLWTAGRPFGRLRPWVLPSRSPPQHPWYHCRDLPPGTCPEQRPRLPPLSLPAGLPQPVLAKSQHPVPCCIQQLAGEWRRRRRDESNQLLPRVHHLDSHVWLVGQMLKPVRVSRKHLQASRPSALRDPEPCRRQAVSDERRTASNSRLRCPLCNRSEATSIGLYRLGRWIGPTQPRQSPRQHR